MTPVVGWMIPRRSSDEDNAYPNFIELLERAENLQRAQKAIAKTQAIPKPLFSTASQ